MSKDDLTTKEQSKKGNKDSSKDSKSKEKKPSFFQNVSRFYKELKSEYKKIVWPTKDALKHNTIVVLTFMGFCAAFIWTLDWIFISIFALMF